LTNARPWALNAGPWVEEGINRTFAPLKPSQRGDFSGARFHCGILVDPKIETMKEYDGDYYSTNFKGDLAGPHV
jgi:hypothetical protein